MHVDSLPVLGGAAFAVGAFFLWLLWALLKPETDPNCPSPEDCKKSPVDCD